MELVRVGLSMTNSWTAPPIVIIASTLLCFGAIGFEFIALPLAIYYQLDLSKLPGVECALKALAKQIGPEIVEKVAAHAVPQWWWLLAAPVAYYVLVEMILLNTPPSPNQAKYLVFPGKNRGFERRWKGRFVPVTILVCGYMDGEVDFVDDDVIGALDNHKDFVSYRITPTLMKFILAQFVPPFIAGGLSSSFHDKESMKREIADHYDRNDDFFRAFLGPMMLYTCAIWTSNKRETLESAQTRKLDTICNKMHLRKGHTMLDIGCGWGTLARHAEKKFKAKVNAVTLSQGGAKWCREKNVEEKTSVDIYEVDYRDIPKVGETKALTHGVLPAEPASPTRTSGPSTHAKSVSTGVKGAVTGIRYDRISSIEMAEHVGIKHMGAYLDQVKAMLADDGIYFQQVAGLRQNASWEDVMWGLFMGRYIFPGADASTPLHWYVNTLERAGFEIRSVETIGVHYGRTLFHWYLNFMRDHKKLDPSHYPPSLIKLWKFFLAWASLAATKGVATCYQIVCIKNTNEFDRKMFYGEERVVGM